MGCGWWVVRGRWWVARGNEPTSGEACVVAAPPCCFVCSRSCHPPPPVVSYGNLQEWVDLRREKAALVDPHT